LGALRFDREPAPARLLADEGGLLRRGGAGEEEGGGVVAPAGRRDEHPALVLLGLNLVGDEGEAELLRKPADRLVIVADDEGDVGEGLVHFRGSSVPAVADNGMMRSNPSDA
jgi:hypothetical protein